MSDALETIKIERDEAIRSCHIWQKGHSDIVKDRDGWKEEAERWKKVNINVTHLEEEAGLLDRQNLALRVKWVNALRAIVGSTMPKNKSGMSLVSDIDLILASDEQRFAALEEIK